MAEMTLNELERQLREDPEFVEAERELRPLLDLGDDIIVLRTKKGWTQAELAVRAGVRQATISQLEGALANPRWDTIQKVADALGARLISPMRLADDDGTGETVAGFMAKLATTSTTGSGSWRVATPSTSLHEVRISSRQRCEEAAV